MNALQQAFGTICGTTYSLLTYMLINLSFDGVMRVHIMLIAVSEDRELTESSLASSFVIKFFFSLVGHDMACLPTPACLPACLLAIGFISQKNLIQKHLLSRLDPS